MAEPQRPFRSVKAHDLAHRLAHRESRCIDEVVERALEASEGWGGRETAAAFYARPWHGCRFGDHDPSEPDC